MKCNPSIIYVQSVLPMLTSDYAEASPDALGSLLPRTARLPNSPVFVCRKITSIVHFLLLSLLRGIGHKWWFCFSRLDDSRPCNCIVI